MLLRIVAATPRRVARGEPAQPCRRLLHRAERTAGVSTLAARQREVDHALRHLYLAGDARGWRRCWRHGRGRARRRRRGRGGRRRRSGWWRGWHRRSRRVLWIARRCELGRGQPLLIPPCGRRVIRRDRRRPRRARRKERRERDDGAAERATRGDLERHGSHRTNYVAASSLTLLQSPKCRAQAGGVGHGPWAALQWRRAR